MSPPPEQGGPRQDALAPDNDDTAKAKLDDTELNVGSPRAQQKVELDLDDAPFLVDEEPAPAAPEEAVPTAPPRQEMEGPVALPLWKNKKVLFGGLGGLLLLIGLAVWWFFIRDVTPPPPPPPPPVEEAPKPVEPAAPPPPQDVFLDMEPFLVEKTDDKGATKVLSLKIKLVYKEDPRVAKELVAKVFALRDGLYYNLKNKSFGNLTDKNSVEQLRDELRGVVNNYLNMGQVEQVLFVELLVK